MKQIIRNSRIPYTFRIYWLTNNNSTFPDSAINLDFNPTIQAILAKEPKFKTFCLIHWQSRPKGLRRWGVFEYSTNSYYSADVLLINSPISAMTIQIDENRVKTVPTAVLLYPNTKIINVISNDNKDIVEISS